MKSAKISFFAVGIAVITMLFSSTGQVFASGTSINLYPGGDNPDGVGVSQTTYQQFWDTGYFTFTYFGGAVCISSQGGQCTAPAIDDEALITINDIPHDYLSYTQDFGPVDLAPFLHLGDNQIRVQLIDRIRPSQGGSQLWLVAANSGGTISGTVQAAAGGPLANVWVHVLSSGVGGCSDANGNYTITGLQFGSYQIEARAGTPWCGNNTTTGYVSKWWPSSFSPQNAGTVNVSESAPIAGGIDFSLDLGGSVSGTILDSDGVTPLANIFVGISNGDFFASACTDNNGHYSTNGLPLGLPLQVQVSPPWTYCTAWSNYVQEFWQDTHNSNEATLLVLTPQNRTRADIDFNLEAGGVISGTAYAADGVTPLQHIAISFQGDNDYNNSVCTDANGHYEFHGAPFDLPLRIRADAYWDDWCNAGADYVTEYWQETPDLGSASLVTVTAAAPERSGIDFTLAAGGSVSGTVYQADGTTPIPNMVVSLNTDNYGIGGCTDSSGHYIIHDVPFGVPLHAQAAPGGNNWCGGSPDYVNEFWQEAFGWDAASLLMLTPAQPTQGGIDFTLDLGGSISGTVYQADGTTPIPNMVVSLNADNYGSGVCTDSAGHYIFSGVPFGLPLRVQAAPGGGNWCGGAQGYAPEYWQETSDWGSASLVTVAPASASLTDINFTLAPFAKSLHVVPSHPEVHGHDWPSGTDVTLTIDADANPGNGVLYTATKNTDDDPWCGSPCFDLSGVFSPQVGQYVSLTDGSTSKTVLISPLHITNIDSVADTVFGLADPGSRVAVNIWSQNGIARYVTAAADGTWLADFSAVGDEDFEQQLADIHPGDNGRAIQLNPDGSDDGTLEYWSVPDAYIKANPDQDSVHVYGWPQGALIRLTVLRSGSTYYTDLVTVSQVPWDSNNPNDLAAVFDLGGVFDLQSGDILVASDGPNTITAAVTELTSVRWFVGLGTGSDPAQMPVEQQVVDDFNRSHAGAELLLEVQPNGSARATLTDEIASGNAPDVVGPVGWQGWNAFGDQWLDLAPLIASTNYDTSQFDPILVETYHTDEGQVGLPFATYPSAIFYNPALFDAAGLHYPPAHYGDLYEMPNGSLVTWDWTTVAEVSKLLTLDENGHNATDPAFDSAQIVQYGFSFGFEANPNYWGSFWQAGDLAHGTPGDYTAEVPTAWQAAWEWVYDGMWGSQPYIPTNAAMQSDLLNHGNPFDSGKLAMLENPAWYTCCLGSLTGSGGTFQLGAMPSYNGQVAGRVDADTFRIYKNTDHPDQAFTVLTYLVGPAVDKLIVGSASQPPAYGGAISAITAKQQAYIDDQSARFPFVTSQSWNVLVAGLAYPDNPSAEGWMPNFNPAWDRLQAFADSIGSTPGLNLGDEISTLTADLTVIFNAGYPPITPTPTVTETPTPSETPTLTPTDTETPTPTIAPTITPTPTVLENSVVVHVQDTQGIAQPGLPVYVFTGTTYTGYSGTTDVAGLAKFTFLPDGNYRFRSDRNGTQFWSSAGNDCAIPGCTSDGVTVTIPVTVTVQDTNGVPQMGLPVYAFSGSTYSNYSATTNASGQAVFTLPVGNYRFRSDRNGTQFWSSAGNDCTVPGCTSDSVTVTIPVTVTVQDTNGVPQAGLPVYAFNGSTYSNYSATTNASGQAVFTLPVGNYRFRSDRNGTQFWSSASNDCAVPGCTSDGVTVTIPVTVTVQDTNGVPQAGLPVYAFSGSTYSNYSATTNASGQAVFTLPVGNYRFRSDRNGTQFWSSVSNDCAIPGCTSDGVTVTIPVTVTVQDTNGVPQVGLPVYAFSGSTYSNYSATTNVSGQAVFTLPVGNYRFRSDRNGTQFWSSAGNDCTVPGCTSDGVTVTIPVTVTVQDTNGVPQSGLPVYAFSGSTYSNYSATTNASGQAVFTLPVGNYRFRSDRNGTQFWSSAGNDCTVPGCTSDGVTVTIPVTVTVQDTNGVTQAGKPVYVFDDTTYANFSGTTNSNGQVVFTLPAGNYRFRADVSGIQYWSADHNNCAIPGCASMVIYIGEPSIPLSVSAGLNFTCLVTGAGGVRCWGDNGTGQLGNGTTLDRALPVTVDIPDGAAEMVAAGWQHTCALMVNGHIWCWGYNFNGELGNGTTTSSSVPVQVIDPQNDTFVRVTAGWNYSCAVTTVGAAKCWGANGFGKLGNNSTADSPSPVYVTGLSSGVAEIAAGQTGTCVLMQAGGVKCWGNNGFGQLGNGTTSNSLLPVDVSLSEPATAIAVGWNHTCAVVNSQVKCWGRNEYGKLGNDSTTNSSTPVDVNIPPADVKSVSAGFSHTCALTTTGAIWCWGADFWGQLGDGAATESHIPVQVSGITFGYINLASGQHHSCAYNTAGGVTCWGYNVHGQLGDGTTANASTPVYVTGYNFAP